ncbi:hypothetical protein GZH49_12015 [Nocardia terpenica]|uniref:hypothetical protein n=1 Tax=Nocardia terpenica TaxID=455432 RepID=UPI002FE1CEA6
MSECRVIVRFDDGLELHYRADREAAEEFARSAAYLAEVTLDDDVDPALPRMPCTPLWEQPTDQLPYVTEKKQFECLDSTQFDN